MEGELTLGDIYEEIAEKLATARTRALMGERQEALDVFRGASLEYRRFRDALTDYPGFHALEHAFCATLEALQDEQAAPLPVEAAKPARTRKKVRQAA